MSHKEKLLDFDIDVDVQILGQLKVTVVTMAELYAAHSQMAASNVTWILVMIMTATFMQWFILSTKFLSLHKR